MSALSTDACRIAYDANATDSSGVGGNRMFATAILTVGIEAPPPYSADKSHWHFDQALLAPVEFLGDFIEPKCPST
jgi:hypothetical protein